MRCTCRTFLQTPDEIINVSILTIINVLRLALFVPNLTGGQNVPKIEQYHFLIEPNG
jgi:hypothetical protein